MRENERIVMTQYTNPNLTQREIVEDSLQAVLAMIETINESIISADSLRQSVLDFQTFQIVGQHISILEGSKYQLENERIRLADILTAWSDSPDE